MLEWLVSVQRRYLVALTACVVTACLDIGDAETPSSSASDSGLDGSAWPSGGKDGGLAGSSGSGVGGSGGGSGGGGDCACVPAPPTGWSGPALLYLGDAPVPACPTSFPTPLLTAKHGGTLNAPPAECSACSCGAATGLGCSGSSLSGYALTGCVGSSTGSGTAPSSGACASFPVGGGQAKASHPQATGSCPPNGGVLTKEEPAWTKEAHLCEGSASTGACGAGEICAPPLVAPFGATYCVHQTGDIECPPQYPARNVVYGDGFDDTRACTSCACAFAPAGCDADVRYYGGGSCTGQYTTKPANGSCNSTNGFVIYSAKLMMLSGPSGSCTPSGGVATGNVSGVDPVTVCCQL